MLYDGYVIYSSVFLVLLPAVYLAIRVATALKKHKINWFFEISRLAFILYLTALISVTLFPIFIDIGDKPSISPISYEARQFPIFCNLNPFNFDGLRSASTDEAVKNIVGNLLLMLPYTILLAFNYPSMQKWKMAVGTALLTSATIELMQLLFQATMLNTNRRTDVTDILQNVIGAAVRFALYQHLFSRIPIFKHFIIGSSEPVVSETSEPSS